MSPHIMTLNCRLNPIHKHLAESNKSLLLILDGLDEIDLKKYPQVNRILCGIDYPSCCVMTTSRPHISLEIKDEMSCIAYIVGFSKESAEKYVEHFIPDPEARREFFRLLAAKEMHDMYKVPNHTAGSGLTVSITVSTSFLKPTQRPLMNWWS